MTTESVAVVPVEPVRVDLGVIRADRPTELVAHATEAANALASVIESRKLFSNIQGKKFVKCEGWTTLAAMLGVTPHEISVTEVDGAFTATVELRRLTDGQPVSRASAECGPDESTWKGRARYARRSMALTRATAKACRLAFSWIMALSGYEVTPAEEIPDDTRGGQPARSPTSRRVVEPKEPASPPPTAQPLTEKPAAIQKPDEPLPQTGPGGGASWKGKPLVDYSSDELVRLKAWCLKANPSKFGPLTEAMDDVLASRQGE